MKMICDVPDEVIKSVKVGTWCGSYVAEKMVANGIPLEQIRDEIDQKQYDFMSDGDYDEGIRFGLMLSYQIIDKYKGRK